MAVAGVRARWVGFAFAFAALSLAGCDDGEPGRQNVPVATDPQSGGTNVATGGVGGGAPEAGTTSGAGVAGQAGSVAPPATGGTGGSSTMADGGGAATPDAGETPQIDAAMPPADAGSPGQRFPSVADVGAMGPYMPQSTASTGPSDGYSLYYPEPLAPDGLKNPIVTWGNGATTTPPLFALLPHLASHGFVVIASNNAFVTGEELRAGIDWLIAENERDGSMFYQKLDVGQVASMGYSLGSLGTFEIAADPRLKTTVHISGGAMNKAVVPNLKHPAAFFCGNDSDIAHANCDSDFELAQVPVFYGVFDGDHLGILLSHTDVISEAVTGWLRWRLMHDPSLEAMFVGPACELCSDPRWDVMQKDFDVSP